MPMKNDFPAFARKLPEAELSVPGLKGWLLQTEKGQFLFFESLTEVIIPPNLTADQSGVVISGQMDVMIGGNTTSYKNGDTYFIPRGTLYQARVSAGFKGIDYSGNRNRFRPKK